MRWVPHDTAESGEGDSAALALPQLASVVEDLAIWRGSGVLSIVTLAL